MEKLDYNQIMEVLKHKFEEEYGETGEKAVWSFAFEGCESEKWGLGEMQTPYRKGGEGQGSEWYSIKYFKDHDVYIKVEGYYSSYNGTDFDDGWDCCSQVVPTQKTITVYE